jgi:hypothetical protein
MNECLVRYLMLNETEYLSIKRDKKVDNNSKYGWAGEETTYNFSVRIAGSLAKIQTGCLLNASQIHCQ